MYTICRGRHIQVFSEGMHLAWLASYTSGRCRVRGSGCGSGRSPDRCLELPKAAWFRELLVRHSLEATLLPAASGHAGSMMLEAPACVFHSRFDMVQNCNERRHTSKCFRETINTNCLGAGRIRIRIPRPWAAHSVESRDGAPASVF